jgi:hypothetical protein
MGLSANLTGKSQDGLTLSASDDLVQNANPFGLQWSGAPSGKKPDALFFIRAVDDLHLIMCRSVVEGAATVLLEKLEECLAPWMIKGWKDFLSKRFQLFDADRLNSFLDRLTARISDPFDVKIFRFHKYLATLLSLGGT